MRHARGRSLLVLAAVCLLLSGCAQSRYAWNGYDDKLYSYYKTPAEADRFMEGLYEVIQDGEASNRVPPGIYAEYGYLLYERGRYPEAVVWFRKERDKWPESRVLMDRMIALATNRAAKPAGQGGAAKAPAPAVENKEHTR